MPFGTQSSITLQQLGGMARLTHFKLCAFSRSVRLALDELDIEVELVEELPWAWRPAFLALNPAGDLPVLELGDGLVLSGAYAISEYMGEMVRRSPPDERPLDLFPGTDEDRAEVRRLVDWFHRKLDAECTREMLRERVEVRMRPELSRKSPDLEMLRALRANLRYHMSYIAYLADQRRWLAGDDMSFADLAAAGHLSCLDYLDEVPWDAYPAARDWYVRLKSRVSFKSLLLDRLAGIAPPLHYGNLDF
ncbi:MAG: glutathione S-transferase family protein [Hyphomicrobiaceae bacterium]